MGLLRPIDLDPSQIEAKLPTMPREKRERLLLLLRERERRQAQRLFFALFADEDVTWDGPTVLDGQFNPGDRIHRRAGYPKHLEFFEAGATYRERLFMAANRVSKTLAGGAYEMSCHLTGLYPDWWPGRRFQHPISAWAAGKTGETTRDIVQLALLGEVETIAGKKWVDGRGVIPGHLLGKPTWKSGIPDFVDTIGVKHVSGRWSTLGFKAYEQGRGAFEGKAKHVIWFDEEPDMAPYAEALLRTMTTNGLVMVTFTPLEGHTEVVQAFLADVADAAEAA